MTITGPAEDIKEFLAASYIKPVPDENGKMPERSPGDLEDGSFLNLLTAHVPMPASLKITSGSNVDMATKVLFGTDEDVQTILAYKWAPERGMVDRASILKYLQETDPKSIEEAKIGQENEKKYGHRDWYNWSIANWGTKWSDSDTVLVSQKPKSLKISFQTAWSPPTPAIATMSQKWPTLKFSLRYYERGAAFQGHFVIKNEEVEKDESREYRGGRGG